MLFLVAAACESPTESVQQPEVLESFRVAVPNEVAEGASFEATVTAVGSLGTTPFTDFTGDVSLTVDVGTITPATLAVSSGTGTGEFTITGAEDDVRITVTSGSATGTVTVFSEGATLRVDDPSMPIETSIPDIEYQPDFDSFEPHPDFGGHPVSKNTLAVMFEIGTSVATVNDILRPHATAVVGGMGGVAGEVPGFLLLRFETDSHGALTTVLEDLEARSEIREVSRDLFTFREAAYLPEGPEQAVGPPGGQWRWTRTPRYGNWGMEKIRAPALWNLDHDSFASIAVGVLDAGFAAHEDLNFRDFNVTLADDPDDIDHGLHVSGTIGAKFGNGIGVDGIAPNSGLVAAMPNHVPRGRGGSAFGDLDTLLRLLNAERSIRVVNISLGIFGSGPDKQIPESDERVARAIHTLGHFVETGLWAAHATWGVSPLVVTSAGNRYGGQAVLNDGFANAGLAGNLKDIPDGPQILAVEALNVPGGDPSDVRHGTNAIAALSNLGGHISAPGAGVLSTVLGGYAQFSGTSMAAPHVAGSAAVLFGIDPQLSGLEVVALLLSTAQPVPQSGAAPSLDAYAAALSIDRLRSGFPVRSRLMDVNGDGIFDEKDIEAALAIFDDPATDSLYSRVDFNGNSYSDQGPGVPFDLNADGSFGNIKVDIEGEGIEFDENAASDFDILCFYAYHPDIYQGDTDRRRELIGDACRGDVVEGADLEIVPDSAQVHVDQEVRLQVVMRDEDGVPVEPTSVSWSTSDASIATTSGSGQEGAIRGVAEGEVTIRASAGGATASATVTVLPKIEVNASLHGVWIDGSTAVAVGSQRTLLVSYDAGQTWNHRDSGVGSEHTTLRGAWGHGDTLYVAGTLGAFNRSTDRGATWAPVDIGEADELSGASIWGQGSTIIVSGTGDRARNLLRSEDGGHSWVNVNSRTHNFRRRIAGSSPFWVAVGGDNISYSTNDGAGWQIERISGANISDVWVDGAMAIAIGGPTDERLFYRTDDSGDSWSTIDAPSVAQMGAIDGHGSIVVAGNNVGEFIRSTDRGASWELFQSPVAAMIRDIFIGEDVSLAVTHSGHILRSTDGGASWGRVN